MGEQDKKASQISDLPEPTKADKDADQVKGGQRMANVTEQGDVTQDGTRGGDTG